MPEFVELIAEWCAAIVELAGLAIITGFAVFALLLGAWLVITGRGLEATFQESRQKLIRGILMGLEFLVAADIIHTVAVELTFTSVGVLAVVVLIRTFLSFTLELEMTGRWPWQRHPGDAAESRRDASANPGTTA